MNEMTAVSMGFGFVCVLPLVLTGVGIFIGRYVERYGLPEIRWPHRRRPDDED